MTGVPPSPAHEHPDAEEPTDWEGELRHHLRGGFMVLGIGSRLRGDDAVGSVIAEQLAHMGFERALDCGGVPENFLGRIERLQPRDILFVDAVDFGGQPGQIAFFGGEKFVPQSISTHSAGLSPLMDFLSAGGEVTCWVLAVQ
ncbi:MAG: hydrogenase maturation protease, partial [Gemmatimonadales bacterium]|nr:hydrogenase maturation protease [Gemmatimonadales bacterium]